jgi:hypothetical protein
MAIDLTATPQATTEIRAHYVDFTKDLPSGVTVTACTAGTGSFPTNGTAGISVGAASGNVYPITITNPSPAGLYDIRGTATLSNTETIVFMLHIPVIWQGVRAGMDYLITELRGMADAGYDDFRVAGVPYWSDKHLQDLLDKHREDFVGEDLYAVEQIRNGTAYWLEYQSQYGNLETVASGTSVFKLDDAAGTNLSGTLWSADYMRGVVTFVNDTLGSTVLLTGRSYDLNAAAADAWRTKSANAAKMYSFSAGGQSFQRAQFMQNCVQMAQYYEGMAKPTNISLYRSDNIPMGMENDE